MRKPAYAICKQQRRRSACASAQSDQPFVVRCLVSIIPLVSIPEISILYLFSVAAQAGLSLSWSQTPKTDFLVTRLTILLCCQDFSQLECFHTVVLAETCYMYSSCYSPSNQASFWHPHVCPDISLDLPIIFGSFKLAPLFIQISSVVTKMGLKGNQMLPFSTLLLLYQVQAKHTTLRLLSSMIFKSQ